MRWMAVWTRAVIVPAVRRAGALWIGAGVVAAVVFGPTGMQPRDLTALALHVAPVGVALAFTWLLLFLPTARVIVRAEAATYLRALPRPRLAPALTAAGALLVLQLPWLTLWLLGAGSRGVALVVGWTLVIVLVARWRLPRRRVTWPRWRSGGRALAAIYARALMRRAGDTLVRGVGLALVAGIAGALLIHNNGLAGAPAAGLASTAIVIVLVPCWAGVMMPLIDAHRASAWLVAALGISSLTRVVALASCVVATYALAASIACLTAAAMVRDPSTITALAGVVLTTAIGAGLCATRLLLWADRAPTAASARAVVGAILAAAVAVLALALFGAVGAVATCAIGAIAIASTAG
jgi:hypothetical protein